MASDNIKTILFDLGRVLISFDHSIASKRIAEFCDCDEADIYNLFFDSDLTAEFEEGKVSAQEFFLKIKKRLGIRLDYNGFLPIWNEIFFVSDDNSRVHSLAISLKSKYSLAMLTNINCLHFDYIKERYNILGGFDRVFTSFELKLKKPDPLIYKKVTDLLGNKPHEIFYTDDRPELIDVAKSLGMRAFIFKDFLQLKRDLLQAGVELQPESSLLVSQ